MTTTYKNSMNMTRRPNRTIHGMEGLSQKLTSHGLVSEIIVINFPNREKKSEPVVQSQKTPKVGSFCAVESLKTKRKPKLFWRKIGALPQRS